MKITACFFATLFLIASMTGCASFPRIRSGGVELKGEHASVKVEFGEKDRRTIRDFYSAPSHHSRKKGLPPGLAKKEKLPPGLQKQLVKNGKLPPGLEKRPLSPELEKKLAPLPKGYVRLKVDMEVIILHEATQVIADIMDSGY
ncbi:MAG: hypothetical protein OEU95_03485 [Nitrospirota bacterium]|nr:hypothetical protein [Nitrospirota bacterium]